MKGVPQLNGFDVPAPLQALLLRPDWPGKRRSEAWLSRFAYPEAGFVEFCSFDQLERENKVVRNPEMAILCGSPNAKIPPGDFDPECGFLIGFTECVDDTICVDFRREEPRIIFYDGHINGFATAFDSLDAFYAFYKEQHG